MLEAFNMVAGTAPGHALPRAHSIHKQASRASSQSRAAMEDDWRVLGAWSMTCCGPCLTAL